MTAERLDRVSQEAAAMGTLVLVEKGTVLDGTAGKFMSRHSAVNVKCA